jgi:iron complex outermembrane recepter protein
MNSLDSLVDSINKSIVSVLVIFSLIINPFSIVNAQIKLEEEKSIPTSTIELEELVVFPSLLNFDFSSDTGSRLDLSTFETPASITVIDNTELKEGGYQEVGKALERSPGFIWGNPPAEPANYSMRGFTSNQVMIQRDGIWLGPALIIGRPQNGFNLDRIEILKGPASVLHGQGAIGAALNMITKKPETSSASTYEFLSSYGRFDSVKVGFGAGSQINKNLWFRFDGSEYSSDGYVDNADPKSRNFTGSLLWKPNDQLDVTWGVDFLEDKLQNYWGTPIVTEGFATQPLTGVVEGTISGGGAAIDERMRFVNYNVNDEVAKSYQILTTLDLNWKHNNNLSFRNYSYFLHADREWRNSENYTFNAVSSEIERDRFFIAHEQKTVGNRINGKYKNTIAGMENQSLLGIDTSYIDFNRKSNPFGTGPGSVNAFAPVAGSFGGAPTNSRINRTRILTVSTFFEDTLKVNEKLRLVVGLRQDHIELDRGSLNDTTGGGGPFDREFNPFSWRVGAVYEIVPNWNLYAQISSGADPLGSDIFIVGKNQNFDLAKSQQWEAGIKSKFLDGKAEMTLSGYHIERQNILIQDSQNSVVNNEGGQRSTGFEFEGSYLVTPKWRVGTNTSFTHAEFGIFDTVSGHTPANVPEWVVNAWTNYSNVAGMPVDVGGAFRFVDDRFNTRFNDIEMLAYKTVDLHATYKRGNGRFTARLTNLFDEAYALWGDEFYSNQLILGSPRAFEISAQFDF